MVSYKLSLVLVAIAVLIGTGITGPQSLDNGILKVTLADDHQALDQVYSLAYEELRSLARAVLRSDRAASLTPTTLVNEAWIKLAKSPAVANTTPLHFRRIAGRAMRQVLVEAARRKHSRMRGGGQMHVTFDESIAGLTPADPLNDFLELDAALSALGIISPRQAQLVEARFFGGLSWAESAESLAISEATVMREWRAARAWLALEMRRGQQRDQPAPG